MFLRPFPLPALAPSLVLDVAHRPGSRARRRLRWARSCALVGAGYLLFLRAHGWTATAEPTAWRGRLLVLGALLLVVAGVRVLLQTRGAFGGRDVETGPGQAAAPELAVAFVGRLYALGPAGWALVVADTRDRAASRAGARAVLCVVLADLRLDRAERRLAREIAAVLRRPGAAHMLPAPRATAHTAALLAVLAVLVRPWLPTRDFEAIYAPFSQLIPAATLRHAGVRDTLSRS